jgi:hypothetical protein
MDIKAKVINGNQIKQHPRAMLGPLLSPILPYSTFSFLLLFWTGSGGGFSGNRRLYSQSLH